jgi:hypothetical protein
MGLIANISGNRNLWLDYFTSLEEQVQMKGFWVKFYSDCKGETEREVFKFYQNSSTDVVNNIWDRFWGLVLGLSYVEEIANSLWNQLWY